MHSDEDITTLADLVPLHPGSLMLGNGPLHLTASPAKTAQTTDQTAAEVIERWPFRVVGPDENPDTAPWTCLRLMLHRLRTDSPLEHDTTTLPQLIKMLSEMEDSGTLRWRRQDHAYVTRHKNAQVAVESQ